MRRLIVTLLSVVTVVVVLAGPSALANHFIYIQEDPNDRSEWAGAYPFNAVNTAWAYGSYDTVWDDDGEFSAEIVNAIQSWENAVPELSWRKAGPGEPLINVVFKKGFCTFESDACIVFTSTLDNAATKATYPFQAEIRLTLAQFNLTSLGIEDQLRHEIGHWAGLNDQYNHNGSCSTVQSVMNSQFFSNGQSCLGIHAPTSLDVQRTERFWNGDGVESVSLSVPSSRNLQANWTDAAWSEIWQATWVYYWDGLQWVFLEYSGYNDNVGFHKDSIPRTMSRSWDLSSNNWPAPAYYDVCTAAYSFSYETWISQTACAPYVFVP